MDPISRRAFIGRASAAVAAAGVVTAVPAGLAGASVKATPSTHVDLPSSVPSDQPVIAHVRNISTGEIAIFAGFDEVTIHDRGLARAIARATGGK
jgi:hypothetical protein